MKSSGTVNIWQCLGFVALFWALGGTAEAATLPWEKPLDTLIDSLTGPVARGVLILSIVTTGGLLCFSEIGGLAKRCLQFVFGASLMLGATSFISVFG